MPRRTDLHKIMVIGSGPIVIGQACEFDYAGSQALKVLREDGFRTIVVNSNPATIMTDPEFADATYVEPLLPGPVAAVIERERPDALLPTLGGQTALNLAKALHEDGTLERFDVELIWATYDAICRAEDRDLIDETMRTAARKSSRSSARWMTSSGAPMSSTPSSSRTPSSASSRARLSAVWPPIVDSKASGRSRVSTSVTPSRSSGSRYVRSANPGSVMIVAGFEFTTIVRKPSSRKTFSAWQPA